MSILQRYVFKNFLVTFFGSVTLFVGLFILIRIIEDLDEFIKASEYATFDQYILFFLYGIPFTFNYLFPMSTLFAIVFLLGKLNSEKELYIFYTTGRSIFYFVYPIAIFIFIICVILDMWGDTLLYKPYQKHKELKAYFNNRLYRPEVNRYNLVQFGKENKIYMINEFIAEKSKLKDVNVLYLDKSNTFKKIFSAENMTFLKQSKLWATTNSIERTFLTNSIVYKSTNYHNKNISETPFHFKEFNAKIEDVSAAEVKQEVNKIKTIGGNIEKWETDYYFKRATPYVSMILFFMGIPLSIFSRNSVMILSFTLVIAATFLYMILMNIGASLGHNKVLSPFFAGWLGNIVFILLDIIFYWKIRK